MRFLYLFLLLALTAVYCRTNSIYARDWRDEVFYYIMTDRFANAGASSSSFAEHSDLSRYQGGNWQGIAEHVDYLQALGITTIVLSPILRNVEEDIGGMGYHGYWTQSFNAINPRFGDLKKLKQLIEKLHKANIRVVLDIVVNHIGQLFFYDQNEDGIPHGSEYSPPYDNDRIHSLIDPTRLATVVWRREPESNHMPIEPLEFQNPSWYHRYGEITDFKDGCQVLKGDFPGGLKDLNTGNSEVRMALAKVYARWLFQLGVDGFRLDSVKHVDKGFLHDFSTRIRSAAHRLGMEHFFQFGEVFDHEDRSVGAVTKQLDSVTYYPMKNVIDGIFKENVPTRLLTASLRLRNHFYRKVPHLQGSGVSPYSALITFLDNHDVPRFLAEKPDFKAFHQALAFLFTWDGIPAIYYGTEQAFSGGAVPNNRELLWQTGFNTSAQTFQWIAKLSQIRRIHSALRRGKIKIIWTARPSEAATGKNYFAFERADDYERVLVVGNASGDGNFPQYDPSIILNTHFAPATQLRDLLDFAQPPYTVGVHGHLKILSIAPRKTMVLVLSTGGS